MIDPFDRAAFYRVVRAALGPLNQSQVDGFERFLDHFAGIQILLLNQAGYVLATAWHETAATMQPITERGSRAYIDGRYDMVHATTAARRQRARAMGNTQPGDGWRYRGRGYVQLTWKNNYRKLGDKLNRPLVDQPELANDPLMALQILWRGMLDGDFTGVSLGRYVNAHQRDYIGARRVVNGTDQAAKIASYAHTFERALLAAMRGDDAA
jgi:hypothetical protein